MKKIIMFGICGKMGKSISGELIKEKEIELVGGFDIINTGVDIGEFLMGKKTGYRIHDSYEDIKFKITGVYHGSDICFYDQPHSIRYAMIYPEKIYMEWSDLKRFIRVYFLIFYRYHF